MESLSEYLDLSVAYSFFNKRLFSSELPDCYLSLQVKANTYGYFKVDSYLNKNNEQMARHEIALNPVYFKRDDKQVLSTLVHEMLHLEQFVKNTNSKRTYHNTEFCSKMLSFGLQCIDSKTGKETKGCQNCTQKIIKGGLFDSVSSQLIETGWSLNWSKIDSMTKGKGTKGKESKVKFSCPECNQNCWGKSTLNVVCGKCGVQMLEA